jgi:hypothetical protein
MSQRRLSFGGKLRFASAKNEGRTYDIMRSSSFLLGGYGGGIILFGITKSYIVSENFD